MPRGFSRYMQPALEIKGSAKIAIVGETAMRTEHASGFGSASV